MAVYTKEALKAIVASYIVSNKIATDTFTATRENSAGLLDKVGLQFSYNTSFKDKLAMFERGRLELGKTIEEWQKDLILPVDKDENGSNTLAPHVGTYRPVSYSFPLTKKVFPDTARFNDLERGVNNTEVLASIVADRALKYYSSMTSYRYAVKRQMLADLIAKAESAMAPTKTFAVSTAYAINEYVKDSNGVPAVVFKAIKNTNTKSFADLVADGTLVKIDLVTEIAKPVDTSTGEAFIEQVQADVEIANDESQGHSLNGNALGASDGLVLIHTQGLTPKINVQTLAGAINPNKLAYGVEEATITDFGNNSTGVYAILCDKRLLGLWDDYMATRTQENAEGDFINYFTHSQLTAHISRNVYFKIYKVPAQA